MPNYQIKHDNNGNKVCLIRIPGFRGFSIQTNGNLVKTNRDGVGPWTQGEVSEYVKLYGTETQKALIGA